MERLKGAAYTKASFDDGCHIHCYRNKENWISPKDAKHPPLADHTRYEDQTNEPRSLKNLLKANE